MSDAPEKIDAAEVRKMAELARMQLSEEEVESFGLDVSRMLHYVAKLQRLDVHDVEPTSHGVVLTGATRPDVPHPGLPPDKVFQNAPERIGEAFGVPKIIE